MKAILISITTFLLINLSLWAQGPCLPEGIEFTTQEELDNFQANYPQCTEIGGNVTISGDAVYNIIGLEVLTSIEGDLDIRDCDHLKSLEGLGYLNSIGGSLRIGGTGFLNIPLGNDSLVSLEGLENLYSVGGDLEIRGNQQLVSLNGLENLSYTAGNLIIGGSAYQGDGFGNPLLSSLEALQNLDNIGGGLYIAGNTSLIDLAGLDNLASIGEHINIRYNASLSSITALAGLSFVGGGLLISHNDLLTNLSGLAELLSVDGDVEISMNNGLTSLTGLENIESIQGELSITGNSGLVSLSGLNNLTAVGGDLLIGDHDPGGNPNLTDLTGLEKLVSVGGDLGIRHNESLENVEGLNNVEMIGGNLSVYNNDALESLFGLQNIDPETIENLIVIKNDQLSECDIKSICKFLGLPGSFYSIYDNAEGCRSGYEITQYCALAVADNIVPVSMSLHPNPTDKGLITLSLANGQRELLLTCFNAFGQEVDQREISSAETVINVGDWHAGIYLAVVYEDGKPVGKAKFVVK